MAAEIAVALDAPLDLVIARKLGCPGRSELGIGAIAEGGVVVRNDSLIAALGLGGGAVERTIAAERAEVERRARRYRGARPIRPLVGRTAIVVDDGLATGFTMRAAIEVVRTLRARCVVVAVPVAPSATVDALGGVADDVVCLRTPASFSAIGRWYDDFHQIDDAEVTALLDRYGHGTDDAPATPPPQQRWR